VYQTCYPFICLPVYIATLIFPDKKYLEKYASCGFGAPVDNSSS
jgi:hypothetical protein